MSTDAAAAETSAATEWRDLPVEHLQLRAVINDGLRQRSVRTVGEAMVFANSGRGLQFVFAPELLECARQLRAATGSNGLDWYSYWEGRRFRFHHLAACSERFDRLARVIGFAAVDRRSLGNAGARLQASGVRTFAGLVAQLRQNIGTVRGIGRPEIEDFFRRLLALSADVEDGRIPQLNCARQTDPVPVPEPVVLPSPVSGVGSLPEAVRQLPISVLQIGVKSEWLLRAGFTTIGHLDDDRDDGRIARLPVIGPRTVRIIAKRLEDLRNAAAAGEIDWDRFSAVSGLPLVPATPPATAAEMLAALPDVLNELAAHLRDDSYRDILLYRLAKPPSVHVTLEALGQKASPPVTRERIRQKEKKLLEQLAGALVHNVDRRLGIQFHPQFAAFWKEAAAEFQGEEEIGYDQFVNRLAARWNVRLDALTAQLPFVLAVVTGEPQMNAAFRTASRLDPALLALPRRTADIRLRHLRTGRICDRLEDQGIETLGALIASCVSGRLTPGIEAVLAPIAAALGPDGDLDWAAYARSAELQNVPLSPPTSPREFVGGFAETVRLMLEKMHATDRRARIFELRTGRPSHDRLTLDRAARELSCHGPTVKREETLLLEELHDVFVGHDFADLPFWLDATWLSRVREAYGMFEGCRNDYRILLSRLALIWGLSERETEAAAAGLWAVFTGYPQGRRRGKRRAAPDLPVPVPEATRIRLRGFRTIH